ncbi:MAG TPA: aminoglycoside phosphotransferase [Gammaproteobacteria bacterium]|nr:aminoglycoside phosphotransferase [Gammaproteobacteria bacterium]
MSDASQPPLIRALLQSPALLGHPARSPRLVETHISWVILTGEFAYKIKKPVNLGFLDFSTLALRRHYCEEELRLNRRLAPQIYLAVVPITGSPEAPRLGGAGTPFEYAVKMRQFDPDQQFDRLLARQALTYDHIDTVARQISVFHEDAAVAPRDSDYGTLEAVWQPVAENHEQILPLLKDADEIARLERLQDWFHSLRARHEALFLERKARGRIRECHGDLHLANIALYRGEVVIFDCLEFNDRLRWIDVISDAAFLVMDLECRGRRDLGFRFLNDYLHHGGDYEGLPLLPYYLAYRAMVRAKVARIRLAQPDLDQETRRRAQEEFRTYLSLAEGYARPPRPALLITHGLSGAGKTTVTQPLLERLGAVRIRSDVERKRLFGLDSSTHKAVAPGRDIYSAAASERTYRRLAELAATVIEAGYPVIVDATFLKRAERESFRRLAKRLRVPFVILHCHAPLPLLRQWIRERQAAGSDASDADLAVLEHQLAGQEPLAEEEQRQVVDIDTETHIDAATLARRVGERIDQASA